MDINNCNLHWFDPINEQIETDYEITEPKILSFRKSANKHQWSRATKAIRKSALQINNYNDLDGGGRGDRPKFTAKNCGSTLCKI